MSAEFPLPLPEEMQGAGFVRCLVAASAPILAARERVRSGARALLARNPAVDIDPRTLEQLLAANLAAPLFMMMAPVTVLELNVARLEGVLEGDTPEQRFASFFERLRKPEVAQRLWDEYVVLAEQVDNRIDKWAACSLEFIAHLCEDWSALRAGLLARDPGALVEIQGAAGDTHRGGHSVMILSFSSGTRLVYKPRSLAVDQHFQELLAWLNDRGAEPRFRLLGVLDRPDHGWVEFVNAGPCASREEITRFYRRQGGYLALLYALGATDFHAENLIAAGEHPVLIDLEALFHPRLHDEVRERADDIAGEAMAKSVLAVGLLPRRTWQSAQNAGVDISGLGNMAGQMSPKPVPTWEQVNTDEMRVVRKHVEMQGSRNVPSIGGDSASAFDYAEPIAQGFADVYRLLLSHRAGFEAQLQRFANDEVRVIVRATRVYGTLLHESFHPDVLRDSAERAALFERLNDAGYEPEKLTPMLPFEREDLLAGDIPLFTTRPSSRDVWTSHGERIAGYLAEPSFAFVQRRLAQLNERDLGRQLWIARASIATMASDVSGPRSGLSREHVTAERGATQGELIAAACAIGDRLEELALGHGEERTWLGLVVSGENQWRLTPIGPDLYDGLPGIALFLAQLARASGEARYAKLARAALATLRSQVERFSSLRAIGAFSGWGGIVYAYSHLHALWGDAALRDEAQALLERISEHVRDDGVLDIIGGSAGCVLALRSLCAIDPDSTPRVAEIARACGEHLLSKVQTTPNGIGWFCGDPNGPPLTGYAHGNAGMAEALIEIAALTGEPRFRDTALAAFAYERALFSPEEGNWPDLRTYAGGGFTMAWCHGAPGIGLSRLCALRHLPDETLRKELSIALASTAERGFGTNYCICHGDLGNAELLLQYAQATQESQWAERARRAAAGVIADARKTGWICGNPLGVESPGLMTGLAGIGHMMLRLADPDGVASVLTLEAPRS